MSNEIPFGGSFTERTGFTLRTGLTTFTPVLVNPTVEEWCAETGQDQAPYQFDYSLVKNTYKNDREERPICIWMKDSNGSYFQVRFNIANEAIADSSGTKFRWINTQGNISYYVESPEVIASNPKMNWFKTDGMRKLNGGEDNLYTFMQTLIKYSTNEPDSRFSEIIIQHFNITPETLYAGDVSGLRAFIDYANDAGFKNMKNVDDESGLITMLLTVREKVTEEGTRYYQDVCAKPDTFFRTDRNGHVTPWSVKELEKRDLKAQAQQRDLVSNRIYTYALQDFDESAVVAAVSTPAADPFAAAPAVGDAALVTNTADVGGNSETPF